MSIIVIIIDVLLLCVAISAERRDNDLTIIDSVCESSNDIVQLLLCIVIVLLIMAGWLFIDKWRDVTSIVFGIIIVESK